MEEKVLIRMDEMGHEGMVAEEILPLLKPHLNDAVNRWLERCEHKYLTGTKIPVSVKKRGEYSYVLLPTDYLRLVEICCKEWQQPVYQAETIYSPYFKMEKNKYLRSSRKHPRVFEGDFALFGESRKMLMARGEYDYGTYQKRVQSYESIDQDIASWFVAGELFEIFGEANKAKTCYEKSHVL